MEGVQSVVRRISHDSSLQPPPPPPPPPPSVSTGVLISRPPRQTVSLGTCSKLCAVCFVAGIVVGYTLKRRVRRWLSSLVRRLKDD